MKVLRSILAFFLILIIIGGLGYIGWSYFYMPMNHQGANTPPNTAAPNAGTPHGGTQGNQHNMPADNKAQTNMVQNTMAVQNRDRLNQAVGTINQALDLITIDPYSNATAPSIAADNTANQPQGNGTINIYPNGNTSVNIAPPGNNTPNNVAPPANTNQGAISTPQNYVYDQAKLQQLHNGIFTLSQGIMMINQLNEDLLAQSSLIESNPPNYQTFVTRYNLAMQNKTRLNNAINLLSQASTLINVNPYAAQNGYPYNKDAMGQLHQGVFKLAQGMAMLNRLNEDFTSQMLQASTQIQSLVNSGYQQGMNHGSMFGTGLFGNLSMSTVFNIILVILIIGLIAGVLGAIFSIFSKKTERPNSSGSRTGGTNVNWEEEEVYGSESEK